MIEGILQLPEMDGKEIRPGIILIGEPSVVNGMLRCLANVYGALCLVELSITLKGTTK